MKKITLAALLAASTLMSYAQVPVTGGLQLHLDAAIGFNANGLGAATWADLSAGGLNNMAAASNALEPTYTTNVLGSGFDGVYFNGTNNYMTNTLNATMSNTEGSIFVVRISNNNVTQDNGSGYESIMSIAEDNGSWINEMGLGSDWAMHHSSSGNWKHLRHQCYTSLPTNRPAILSGIYGTDEADIDFVINDIHSTQTIFTQSAPWDYSVVNRKIALGGRYQGSPVSTTLNDYYDGYILEVLVYDRKLSIAEQHDVNQYLKCKYNIDYNAQLCNDLKYECDKCFSNTNLNVIQTGYDANGNCTFTATATGHPGTGGSIIGYEWDIPGVGSFVVPSTSTTNVQNFTLSPLSGGVVRVKIHAVRGQWEPGESPCCEWETRVQVYCKEQRNQRMESTGIGQAIDNNGIAIYPNPTDNVVNILNTKGMAGKVSVTDFTGKVILNQDITKNGGKLSLEGKPAGVYMVQLTDANGSIIKTEKLILK